MSKFVINMMVEQTIAHNVVVEFDTEEEVIQVVEKLLDSDYQRVDTGGALAGEYCSESTADNSDFEITDIGTFEKKSDGSQVPFLTGLEDDYE